MLSLLMFLIALKLVTADVTLKVVNSGDEFHGWSIDHINFASGYKGALIKKAPVPYLIHPTNHTLHELFGNSRSRLLYNIGQRFNTLIAEQTPSVIPAVVDENGFLTINGSRSVFYSCPKLKWDPYGLADSTSPGVGIFGESELPIDGCKPIKITVTNTYNRPVH